MVATLSRLRPGAENYHLALVHPRYLEQGGEPPGKWLGHGAALLSLSGSVTQGVLANLLLGLTPTGEENLVENALRPSRTPGVDLCLSPPKDVSLLFALGDRELSERTRALHHEAVSELIHVLEDNLTFTRRGKGGTVLEKSSLVIAGFEHGSSRPAEKDAIPDPQLHEHLLVANVAPRADGTWGALDLRPFFRNVATLGAVYDLALSNRIDSSLGLEVERRARGGFGIKGCPERLRREFSKRTAVIEDRIAEELLSTSKAKKEATLHTRHYKRPRPRGELFSLWQKRASELGLEALPLRASTRRVSRSEDREFSEALSIALSEITEKESHFSFLTLLRHVCQNAHGRGLEVSSVIERTRGYLEQSQDIVRLIDRNGERQYTTRELFEVERSLLQNAEEHGRKSRSHVLSRGTVDQALKEAFRDFEANHEQKKALTHLTQTRGAIKILTGEAGTGKSTLLTALRIAYEKQGFTVIGGALAARTARGLEKDTGIPSDTLAKYFTLIDRKAPLAQIKENLTLKPLVRDLLHGRGVRNRPFFHKPQLPRGCVFVLDEAGMVGTRDMERLLREVKRAGGKLVLSGDAAQLQPIAAGLPMASLAARLGEATLSEVVRQREKWARDAGKSQRKGRSNEALRAFSDRGLLVVKKDTATAIDAMVSRYVEISGPASEKLVVSGSNATVRRVNLAIQRRRKDAKEISGEALQARDYYFHTGDRVLFLRNDAPLGVSNGDLGEVVSVSPAKNRLTVRLDRGDRVSVDLSTYRDIALGYAITTHKAQGVTVKNALVLLGGAMQDRELSYVQLTRARENTWIFTSEPVAGPELLELSSAMTKSRRKTLAHDLEQLEA